MPSTWRVDTNNLLTRLVLTLVTSSQNGGLGSLGDFHMTKLGENQRTLRYNIGSKWYVEGLLICWANQREVYRPKNVVSQPLPVIPTWDDSRLPRFNITTFAD